MVLIEKACPPEMMIEQVKQWRDDEEEKIKQLDHINIHEVEQLIKQPFAVQRKIHVYIRVWNKLAKNEVEDYKCNAQLGLWFLPHLRDEAWFSEILVMENKGLSPILPLGHWRIVTNLFLVMEI